MKRGIAARSIRDLHLLEGVASEAAPATEMGELIAEPSPMLTP